MADTWEEEVRQKLRCGEAMEAMKAGAGEAWCGVKKKGISIHFRWGLGFTLW